MHSPCSRRMAALERAMYQSKSCQYLRTRTIFRLKKDVGVHAFNSHYLVFFPTVSVLCFCPAGIARPSSLASCYFYMSWNPVHPPDGLFGLRRLLRGSRDEDTASSRGAAVCSPSV